jgi:putative peptidoglycan lipid II flippase
VYQPQPGWAAFSLKLLAALAVMGGGLWFGAGSDADWLRYGLAERIGRLALLTGFGALAYFATLWALGFRLKDFKQRAA